MPTHNGVFQELCQLFSMSNEHSSSNFLFYNVQFMCPFVVTLFVQTCVFSFLSRVLLNASLYFSAGVKYILSMLSSVV